jgi:outer membrane usher protein
MLTLSIPLGGTHGASYSVNRTNNQGTSHDVSLNGALLDDYSLTYALQTGVTTGREENNGNHGFGSIGYSSPIGVANLSHAYARNSSSTSADFSGALYVDGQGVLPGQSMGETAIVVDAPGARGVVVDNFPGVRTNGQGRALIPYAQPYRENRVSLKASPEQQDATLEQNVQTVVPTRGAIVVAKFDTELGRSRLAILRDAHQAVLPFGAAVYGPDGRQRGIVGPVGRVWLTGLKGESRFTVKWGEGRQCAVTIEADAAAGGSHEARRDLICK